MTNLSLEEKLKLINEENRQISSFLKQINKKFGDGTIYWYGDEKFVTNYESWNSGVPTLNLALGNGGYVKGRIIEISGKESSGKTTISLASIASAQRSGGICAFIDAEHSLDPVWAKRNGVDLESMLFSQPDTLEQALNLIKLLIQTKTADVIIVDSVAALMPESIIDKDFGDKTIAERARLFSDSMPIFASLCNENKVTLILINQERDVISKFGPGGTTTPGGRAIKHYSTYRLTVSKMGLIKRDSNPIGQSSKVTVKKNKVSPPFKETTVEIYFDEEVGIFGISRAAEVFNTSVALRRITNDEGKITNKGNLFYNFSDGEREMLGNGLNNSKIFLAQNEDILELIESDINRVCNFKEWIPFNTNLVGKLIPTIGSKLLYDVGIRTPPEKEKVKLPISENKTSKKNKGKDDILETLDQLIKMGVDVNSLINSSDNKDNKKEDGEQNKNIEGGEKVSDGSS